MVIGSLSLEIILDLFFDKIATFWVLLLACDLDFCSFFFNTTFCIFGYCCAVCSRNWPIGYC